MREIEKETNVVYLRVYAYIYIYAYDIPMFYLYIRVLYRYRYKYIHERNYRVYPMYIYIPIKYASRTTRIIKFAQLSGLLTVGGKGLKSNKRKKNLEKTREGDWGEEKSVYPPCCNAAQPPTRGLYRKIQAKIRSVRRLQRFSHGYRCMCTTHAYIYIYEKRERAWKAES